MLTVDEKIVGPIELEGAFKMIEKVPFMERFAKVTVKADITVPDHFDHGRCFIQCRNKPSPQVGLYGWEIMSPGSVIRADFDNPFSVKKDRKLRLDVSSTALTGQYEIQVVLVSDQTGMSWTCEPFWVVVANKIPSVPKPKVVKSPRKKGWAKGGGRSSKEPAA